MSQNIKKILKKLLFPFLSITLRQSKKIVYFTFDDGPLNGTKNCYELCMTHMIKATFFMVGSHINDISKIQTIDLIRKKYPFLLIANHSFSHANEKYLEFYQNPNEAFMDFILAQESMQLVGKIIRLPGKNSWWCQSKITTSEATKPLCNLLAKNGFEIYGWDIEYNSYKYSRPIIKKTPDQLLHDTYWHLFFSKLFKPKKVIVLLHDVLFEEKSNATHLESFINLLKRHKFVFETLESY